MVLVSGYKVNGSADARLSPPSSARRLALAAVWQRLLQLELMHDLLVRRTVGDGHLTERVLQSREADSSLQSG